MSEDAGPGADDGGRLDRLDRRDLLKIAGGAGLVGAAGCFALATLDREADAPTERVTDEEARTLAESYAPYLYFDEYEKWFPTDPRSYERERDDGTVVDGFDALDGYTRAFEEAGDPPDPVAFYNVRQYEESPLAVVQYWLYSAFDQFSTNFHWHDWELVQVFVDRDEEVPVLFVASAHSRKVPNNEFLDPDPETVPRILAELGSHSSGLSVNDVPDRFYRLPLQDTPADITNRALTAVETVAEIPAAYGLPRDEGFRLPFVVPELDDDPLYDHEDLPSVERESLLADALTVHSFRQLASPPEDLPERATGLLFAPTHVEGEVDGREVDGREVDGREVDGREVDVQYDLAPSADLEHVVEFTGPQLSFEFPIPEYVEDRIASHITTTGVPWDQPRYENPAADITEPAHRSALADRYDAIGRPGGINRVVASVQQFAQAEEAPAGEGVTTQTISVEALVLLESDPEAVPTFNGVALLNDVDPGEHRMTVTGPGYAPYSERVVVGADPEPAVAGANGTLSLSSNEQAVKVRVDPSGADHQLTALAVDDDFGGRLYDAPLRGRDAVYVDRRGAYTTEVQAADGELGAFRTNPSDEDVLTVDRPETGKASLASFVGTLAQETRGSVLDATDLDVDEFEADTDDGLVEETTTTSNQERTTATATPTEETVTEETATEARVNEETFTEEAVTESEPTTVAETTVPEDTTDDTDAGTTTDPIDQTVAGVRGLVQSLDAITSRAAQATELARERNLAGADRELDALAETLELASERLAESRDRLPDPVYRSVGRRLEQSEVRTEQALAAER
jgi:hypothetical protein